jgi:parallel beta-helix repeat protein
MPWRVTMRQRQKSIGVVCLLVIGGFFHLPTVWNENARGDTIVGGTISADTIWDLSGSPYIIVDNIEIVSGVSLTIEPGVEVKFDGTFNINVMGILYAIGTEASRITITSNKATPLPGDWGSIGVGGHAEIKYCDISYGSAAIDLGNSNNNITDNNILYNELSGVVIIGDDYNNNNILRNNISYNKHGIFLNRSFYSHIAHNEIFSNSHHGIDIAGGEYNVIVSNNISKNQNGIYLSPFAINNHVYHNNIIDNFHQAYDSTNDSNQWDDFYPSGGNYWSDYNGVDFFQGPNQNIPGSDGIGDTPYEIDSDSQDNYPFMKPFGINFNDPDTGSIPLYCGWNLISIPLIQSDTNLNAVLSSISGTYDAIQWYNNGDDFDHWKNHHTTKPANMNDLNDIDHKMSFWVHISEPNGVSFQYSGTWPVENQNIILSPGWNLVGYPSTSNRTRDVGLNNIIFGSDVDSIQTHDAVTQQWKELEDSDSFVPGRGYWMHSKVEVGWEVPL